MAGAKETPRQKMIGMMYLVLTALLALNVSRDILNAFITMDQSLVATKNNFTEKNELLYSEFERAKAEDEKKVGEWYNKAMLAKKYSNELVDFIEDIRAELIVEVDGVTKEIADTMGAKDLKGADNYDIPTHFLCGPDDVKGHNGKAHEINLKAQEYKDKLLNLLDEKVRTKVKLGLDMSDSYNPVTKKIETWEIRNFYHNVAAAAVAILNKTILEVRNAESEVVRKLLESITASDFKFDVIRAKVIPKSNYVLAGTKYEADIFVAAYSSTQNPVVEIGNLDTNTLQFKGEKETIVGKEGKVKYETEGKGLGAQSYSGVIKIKGPDGNEKPYPFSSEYFVARPSATISADKMNVFYIGLENPVSISVPGVPAGEEKVSITGAEYKRLGAGKYIVKPHPNSKEVVVTVSAEVAGKVTRMGSQNFRIKNIPPPTPKVGGKTQGVIAKSLIKANPYVVAELEDFLFEGVNYRVVSFNFSTTINGLIKDAQCQGNKLSSQAISLIDQVPRNSKIYFEDIKAIGPDGKTKQLNSVILKLN